MDDFVAQTVMVFSIKDLKGAEDQYRLAVENNQQSSEALGSYASFLHGVKGDLDGAQELYEVRDLECDS